MFDENSGAGQSQERLIHSKRSRKGDKLLQPRSSVSAPGTTSMTRQRQSGRHWQHAPTAARSCCHPSIHQTNRRRTCCSPHLCPPHTAAQNLPFAMSRVSLPDIKFGTDWGEAEIAQGLSNTSAEEQKALTNQLQQATLYLWSNVRRRSRERVLCSRTILDKRLVLPNLISSKG